MRESREKCGIPEGASLHLPNCDVVEALKVESANSGHPNEKTELVDVAEVTSTGRLWVV